MRFKADLPDYLHRLRARELELAFAGTPAGAFARGLELGAGDGWQSDGLLAWVGHLTVTDYYPRIEQRPDTDRKTHRRLDAEAVGDSFPPGSFDLIFSSNLLEHLPDVRRALRGTRRALADDGLAVHVVPSAFWKAAQLALFPVDFVLSRLDRYGRGQGPWFLRRGGGEAPAERPRDNWNNPKQEPVGRGWLRRTLLPPVHGVAGGHLAEFLAFRNGAWRALFAETGFAIVREIAGPASSGHAFGWTAAQRACEALGLSSETIFVLRKRD